MNKRIKWLLFLLFPLAGFSIIVFGGYSFTRGDDSPIYLATGSIFILIGAYLFIRAIDRKKIQKESLPGK